MYTFPIVIQFAVSASAKVKTKQTHWSLGNNV